VEPADNNVVPALTAHTATNGLVPRHDCTLAIPSPGEPTPSVIPYDANLLADPALWDGDFGATSIYGTKESFGKDISNITLFLNRAATYIKQRNLAGGDLNSLQQLKFFGNAAWEFLTSIYESQWDKLLVDNHLSFRNKVAAQFAKIPRTMKETSPTSKMVKTQVSKIPPLIPPRMSKEELRKAEEKRNKKKKPTNKSFAQVARNDPENLLKLREAFPALPNSKIIEMNNISQGKQPSRTKTQITTKSLSRKHIIIPMDAADKNNILNHANNHVGQINNLFRSYKSNTGINCI